MITGAEIWERRRVAEVAEQLLAKGRYWIAYRMLPGQLTSWFHRALLDMDGVCSLFIG
jgi:hypothetical protein